MVFSQIPHMTYQQYRTARRLVHECCNYDCGNCLLLDNSEECAKNALSELSAAGLIERKRRGQFLPNLIYVKLPDGQKIIPPQKDNGLSITGVENDLRNS